MTSHTINSSVLHINTESTLLDDRKYVKNRIDMKRAELGIVPEYKNRSENEKQFQRKKRERILKEIEE